MSDAIIINGSCALADHILSGHDCVQDALPEESLIWLSQCGNAQLEFYATRILPIEDSNEAAILRDDILLNITQALINASKLNITLVDEANAALINKAAQKIYGSIRFDNTYYDFISRVCSSFEEASTNPKILGTVLFWDNMDINSRANTIIHLGQLLLDRAEAEAQKMGIDEFGEIDARFKWAKLEGAVGVHKGIDITLDTSLLTDLYYVDGPIQAVLHECFHRIDDHIRSIKGINFNGFDILHIALTNFIFSNQKFYDDVLYDVCPLEKHEFHSECSSALLERIETSRKLDKKIFGMRKLAGDLASSGLFPA